MSILKNSLIINFTLPAVNSTGTYLEISVNGNVVHSQYEDVNGLYAAPIFVGDTISVTLYNLDINNQQAELYFYRKNYTTDDVLGDDGITIDSLGYYIAPYSASTYTFPNIIVTPNNSSYELEYLLDIGAPRITPPTPGGGDSGKFFSVNSNGINRSDFHVSPDFGQNLFNEGGDNSNMLFTRTYINSDASRYLFNSASPATGSWSSSKYDLGYIQRVIEPAYGTGINPTAMYPLGNKGFKLFTSSNDNEYMTALDVNNKFYYSNDGGDFWNYFGDLTSISSSGLISSLRGNYIGGFPIYLTTGGYDNSGNFYNGYVYKLSTSGGSFTQVSALGNYSWSNYLISSDFKYHLAVGAGGTGNTGKFMLSTDSGSTYTQIFTSISGNTDYFVDISNDANYILINTINEPSGDILYLSSNRGTSVTVVYNNYKTNGLGVSANGQYMYAIRPDINGNFRKISESVDYGASFTDITTITTINDIYKNSLAVNK